MFFNVFVMFLQGYSEICCSLYGRKWSGYGRARESAAGRPGTRDFSGAAAAGPRALIEFISFRDEEGNFGAPPRRRPARGRRWDTFGRSLGTSPGPGSATTQTLHYSESPLIVPLRVLALWVSYFFCREGVTDGQECQCSSLSLGT